MAELKEAVARLEARTSTLTHQSCNLQPCLAPCVWDARLLDEVEARCWAAEKALSRSQCCGSSWQWRRDRSVTCCFFVTCEAELQRELASTTAASQEQFVRFAKAEPSDVAANPGTGPAHASRPSGGSVKISWWMGGGGGGGTLKNLLYFQLLFLSCGQQVRSELAVNPT